jgi:hypothetical protein
LVIDNNIAQLTLGTGGILSRFDYIATLNGSSIVNDKSIVNSATTLYWYDFDKNEICALTNGVLPLSKTKSVQSYLNTLPRTAKTNAVSFYDKKYNEVWFRIYNKSLIYNEQLQTFTSFYTHNPNWFFPFSDKLVTIKDDNLYYLHNIYEINGLSMACYTPTLINGLDFEMFQYSKQLKMFQFPRLYSDSLLKLIEIENENNYTVSNIRF